MCKRRGLGLVALAIVILGVAACDLFQPPGVDMSAAIDVVENEVLPDAVPPGATFLCLRMGGSIPAGSVIEEDAPQGATPQGRVLPKRVTVGEESFFFFLDLAPGTYYEHPVNYILVGKSGGYQVVEARWWPKINGETPSQFTDPTPAEQWIVAGNTSLGPVTGAQMMFDFEVLFRTQREGFIVVQGLMSGENLFDDANATYLNGVSFFNAYKTGFSEVEGLVMSQAANVLDEIDSMVEKKLNPITIYIIAHGGVDGVSLGGQWFTAQQFRDKMNEHSSTLFNFLLGSCESGSFMDDLNTLSNVRVVQTACAADEGAKPDWDSVDGVADYNPEDTGSEWTSSILRAAELIIEDAEKWYQIKSLASSYSVPVTSVLLDAAWFGALGAHTSFGMNEDLDLSHRTGHTEPQRYRSWLLYIVIPPLIPLP